MTKSNFTSISVVLDRSGSMAPLVPDTIGGFNTFLAEQQKAPGNAVLTLATFASDYTLVHDCVPIKEVPRLTVSSYQTGGYTALLDAIARTINATGAKLAAMPESERPSQVLLVVITDGEENASKEFAHAKVFEMIKHQQERYSWSVVYLGANQDAIKVGSTLGVAAGNTLSYAATSAGTHSSYGAISSNTTMLRKSGKTQISDFFNQQATTTSSTPATTTQDTKATS